MMPMPTWWGQVNKRVFNPGELRRGQRPVLGHVGRSSGKTYRTPLDAHRIDDGYVFVIVYGPRTDWLRNVLAAGSATLEIDSRDLALTNPRLISMEEALVRLPAHTKRPPAFLGISECLVMDISS